MLGHTDRFNVAQRRTVASASGGACMARKGGTHGMSSLCLQQWLGLLGIRGHCPQGVELTSGGGQSTTMLRQQHANLAPQQFSKTNSVGLQHSS